MAWPAPPMLMMPERLIMSNSLRLTIEGEKASGSADSKCSAAVLIPSPGTKQPIRTMTSSSDVELLADDELELEAATPQCLDGGKCEWPISTWNPW